MMTDPMEILHLALECEHSGEPEESIPLYQKAIDLFISEMEKQSTLAQQNLYFNFILKYIDRIEEIKKKLSKKNNAKNPQENTAAEKNVGVGITYNDTVDALEMSINTEEEVSLDTEEDITASDESSNSYYYLNSSGSDTSINSDHVSSN
ncbi:uncharacterized protein LOC119683355 [Teleopsis dalmanni]|uniref:uncharacterized protein LOC119683355 n=1 Tax=Teleopsis dalmanni TaxID=139649 RepID=UPI0018CFE31A|nr:uncharacterized protein LOC119683355 [Teleopsis dalmanni]